MFTCRWVSKDNLTFSIADFSFSHCIVSHSNYGSDIFKVFLIKGDQYNFLCLDFTVQIFQRKEKKLIYTIIVSEQYTDYFCEFIRPNNLGFFPHKLYKM